ncbi:MAG: GIY-YIG nuclease family protein [Acidobacteriaceae bacterium]
MNSKQVELTIETLFPSEPWRRNGSADHEGVDVEGPDASPVIYILRDSQRRIFYVGQSKNIEARFRSHRRSFGTNISYEIIQTVFEDETPREAERRWIVHYLELGEELTNQQSYKPPKERMSLAEIDKWIRFHERSIQRLCAERLREESRLAEIERLKKLPR